jgi:hypothetical protein
LGDIRRPNVLKNVDIEASRARARTSKNVTGDPTFAVHPENLKNMKSNHRSVYTYLPVSTAPVSTVFSTSCKVFVNQGGKT